MVSSKTSSLSISYETSSKIHLSSLQNEGFARDSSRTHFKSAKRAFRTRLPPKVTRQSQNGCFVRDFLQKSAGRFIGTHASSSPAKQFRDSSPSKQHPLTRQSRCHSDIHLHHNSQPHDSLRLPRKFARPHLQHARNVTPPHLATLDLLVEQKQLAWPKPSTKVGNVIAALERQNQNRERQGVSLRDERHAMEDGRYCSLGICK